MDTLNHAEVPSSMRCVIDFELEIRGGDRPPDRAAQ